MRQLPPESRLIREHVGHPVWSQSEHLLAGIFDVVQWANFQRSGNKGERPKPIPRPGSGPKTFGKAIPFEEAKERLRRRKLGLPA